MHGVANQRGRRVLVGAPLLRWLRLREWPGFDFMALFPLLQTLDLRLRVEKEYAQLEAFIRSPHARHLRLRVSCS